MATERQIEAAAELLLPLTDATPDYARAVIRDALDAAERAAWEPISTVPRDGTKVYAIQRNMPIRFTHTASRGSE